MINLFLDIKGFNIFSTYQDQLKNYDDSDAESHGSEEEVLENAGVWNVEEAHRILRDKMKKLQKLYALQMKHLHMEYKSQRRKYLLEKAQCLNRNKSGSHPMQNQQPTFQDFKVFVIVLLLSEYQNIYQKSRYITILDYSFFLNINDNA